MFPPFSNDQNDPVSFLKNDTRYHDVSNKLCEKRRILEIKTKECEGQEKEELLLSLIRLKESMRTFGISEVDYRIYCETMN